MKVIEFLIANWDFILLIVAAIICIVYAVFKGNKSVVMKMLYALVTEAEKEFGAGTGSLKLASVISTVYPKLPAVIKTFVSDKTLQKWIEEALALAKESWEKNILIQNYINVSEDDEFIDA